MVHVHYFASNKLSSNYKNTGANMSRLCTARIAKNLSGLARRYVQTIIEPPSTGWNGICVCRTQSLKVFKF